MTVVVCLLSLTHVRTTNIVLGRDKCGIKITKKAIKGIEKSHSGIGKKKAKKLSLEKRLQQR